MLREAGMRQGNAKPLGENRMVSVEFIERPRALHKLPDLLLCAGEGRKANERTMQDEKTIDMIMLVVKTAALYI